MEPIVEAKTRQRTPSEGLPTINWRGQQRYPEWRWYTYALITLALVTLCALPFLIWYYLDPPHLLASLFLGDDSEVVTPAAVAETTTEAEAPVAPTGTVTITMTALPGSTTSPTGAATAVVANNSQVATATTQAVTPVSTPRVASSTIVVNTPTPSPTPAPTIQVPPNCESKARFAGDVSVPDGTEFTAGDTFEKTWRLQNAGTCPWGPGYTIRFTGGDPMGPARQDPLVNRIEPNAQGEITIPLVAPEEAGTYRGNWQMYDLKGQAFGPEMYLEIKVTPPDPTKVDEAKSTILYDFVENASKATWTSGVIGYTVRDTPISEALELPAPQGLVATGIAQLRGNVESDQKVLLTYPHQDLGLIEGKYPITTTLQPTDSLVATLGFTKLSILSDDGVTFEVGFTPQGGQEHLLLSQLVQYQDSPVHQVIPLSTIQPGQTGTFTLRVKGGESLNQDWAIWQELRLIRP
jgi:hypothetical protein